MFQYFYLISLLLCIKLVFSYEYLEDNPGKAFHSYGKKVRKINTSGKRKDRKNSIRQDYGYDKNPVEFDLAGFIQPDETFTDDEVIRRRNQRRRISKNNDYNSVFGLNVDEVHSRDANPEYLGYRDSSAKLNPTLMDLAPPLLRDSLNIKKIKMNAVDESNAKYGHEKFKHQIILPEPNSVHNPQKKCILKGLKIPFFSRYNKTEALKPKKTRKRKLFSFHRSKKNSKEKLNLNEAQVDLIPDDKKIKRSYEENMCPACKKKFVTFESNDKPWNKKLHNRLISEKYTDARVNVYPKETLYKFTKSGSEDFGEDAGDIQRNKREDAGILMRRELDVIQQMIEHEDGIGPSNAKSTPSPSPPE